MVLSVLNAKLLSNRSYRLRLAFLLNLIPVSIKDLIQRMGILIFKVGDDDFICTSAAEVDEHLTSREVIAVNIETFTSVVPSFLLNAFRW